jgi:hypothetical protein
MALNRHLINARNKIYCAAIYVPPVLVELERGNQRADCKPHTGPKNDADCHVDKPHPTSEMVTRCIEGVWLGIVVPFVFVER